MAFDITRSKTENAPEVGLSSTPLRIGILSYRCAPNVGGQGVYVDYLSSALANAGHKVSVISGPPHCETHADVTDIHLPSLDLYAQPNNGHYALRPHHLLSPTDSWEYFGHLSGKFVEPYTFGQRAFQYLKKHQDQFDIILDNQCLASGILKLQTELDIPLVTMIHHPITEDLKLALDNEPDFWMRQLIRRWYSFHKMQIRVARQLTHVISPSAIAKDHIVREFGLVPDRITPIRLGVDRAFFKPDPSVARVPGRIVVTASADSPLKGVRYLVEACGRLKDQVPDLHLHIVGKSLSDETTAKIKEHGLEDRVTFLTGLSREEIAREFQSASLLVSPSLYEGFGLPAAEAMSCGTPVIVTDGGALPEVAGEAGVIVPKGDADALAEAISSLLTDDAQRASIAAACLKRADETFDWSVIAGEYEAYFRSVMNI